ncbi:MAG: dTMP kinase [Candidatus Berkelbacteria bacterium Athens1014_28]|uniref:Thymidylate kinase n=1 Tax=Candidatus Berkelbacteria bacterium Athens1014_28 TaxID=2017145 RepID=A0A554LLS5_9BACT|nr:MAG: dTMP kinase [Candidatus Berkelbacteria bacterium Athens1014_28]
MVKLSKGLFIVFDGPEGAGKSTQIQLLQAAFAANNKQVVVAVDPGGTCAGLKICEILKDQNTLNLSPETEALLFAASRAQLINEIIQPALTAGKVVICDRFVSASHAYQGSASGVGDENISWLYDFISGGLWPDLFLIFSLDPEKGLRRKTEKDRIELRPLEFHQAVLLGFKQFAEAHQGSCQFIFAGTRAIDIHKQIIEDINSRFDLTLPAQNI